MHTLVRRAFKIARVPTPDEGRALDDVLHQIELGKERSTVDAQSTVERNIVSLQGYDTLLPLLAARSYASCGLLLTRNGFALTTLHGLRGNKRNQIQVGDREYDAFICQGREDTDLALVKIDLDGPAEAIAYRFHMPWTISSGMPVRLIGFNRGPITRYGLFKKLIQHQACYETDVKTEQGLSGSVTLADDGSILGIHVRGSERRSIDSRIDAGLDLVARYRARLREKHGI